MRLAERGGKEAKVDTLKPGVVLDLAELRRDVPSARALPMHQLICEDDQHHPGIEKLVGREF